MVGPHGERDYVEKILELGFPCICGPFPEDAGIFPETCAKRIAANLRKNWMNPHESVELERQ